MGVLLNWDAHVTEASDNFEPEWWRMSCQALEIGASYRMRCGCQITVRDTYNWVRRRIWSDTEEKPRVEVKVTTRCGFGIGDIDCRMSHAIRSYHPGWEDIYTMINLVNCERLSDFMDGMGRIEA